MSRVGVVIIGRNEGERLLQCLESVSGGEHRVIYVDSGSTDGSVDVARKTGAEIVELDLSTPFTAARARNEGLSHLTKLELAVEYVQFIDGDCILRPNWLREAAGFLDSHRDYAVACGRLRERFPERSIYNRLCDMEWDTRIGEGTACGGIAMMPVEAFRQVGGFDPSVIAAEDNEICVRLRRAGWRVFRLDAEMAVHDANMTRLSQWWNRAKRAGHAYAQGAALHGASPERHFLRQCRSTWFWGLFVPLLALLPAWWTLGASLLLLLGYPLLAVRIYAYGRRRGWGRGDARLYAVFTVLAKWPQLLGMLQYHRNRWRGRRPTLIEYKEMEAAA